MDAVLIALPGLLFSAILALPLALGTIAAVRHLRAGSRSDYLQHLAGSIAAGAVELALLWGSFFGDDLSGSSTAALILVVAPFYAAAIQGLVYVVVGVILKKSTTHTAISTFARLALLIPLLMLAVFMAGLVTMSMRGNDSNVAQRVSNPQTLYRLLEKSRTGEADSFAIPFNLAENPHAPPDMLSELAKSDNASVRARVASNPATPPHVVETLRYDCAYYVRESVEERLGPRNAPEPAPASTGVCPPKSSTAEAEILATPFNMAANPSASRDMLRELAKSDKAAVRARVAGNPATPKYVVESLRYDCASYVREKVVERLGPPNSPEPAPAPTGVCTPKR